MINLSRLFRSPSLSSSKQVLRTIAQAGHPITQQSGTSPYSMFSL